MFAWRLDEAERLDAGGQQLRNAVLRLTVLVGLIAGAPFALIAPGPRWRPRRTIEGADLTPPAE